MKLGWILWLASVLGGNVQEQTCLATTVYLESRDQPVEGQYAVAEVALRRRDIGRWGGTLCEVVGSDRQFAPTLVSQDYRVDNMRAWQGAWKVAGNSMQMWRLPPAFRKLRVPGADHFFAHELTRPAWLDFAEPIAVIGGHSFVRVDGIYRAPAMIEVSREQDDGSPAVEADDSRLATPRPAPIIAVRGAG